MTTFGKRLMELFDMTGRVALITGGAGLLGFRHGEILAAAGASVILLDLERANPTNRAEQLQNDQGSSCLGISANITSEESLLRAYDTVLEKFGRIDVLINNAANNPK